MNDTATPLPTNHLTPTQRASKFTPMTPTQHLNATADSLDELLDGLDDLIYHVRQVGQEATQAQEAEDEAEDEAVEEFITALQDSISDFEERVSLMGHTACDILDGVTYDDEIQKAYFEGVADSAYFMVTGDNPAAPKLTLDQIAQVGHDFNSLSPFPPPVVTSNCEVPTAVLAALEEMLDLLGASITPEGLLVFEEDDLLLG